MHTCNEIGLEQFMLEYEFRLVWVKKQFWNGRYKWVF